MTILNRYLIRTVIEATLLAMLVLIGMQCFIIFVRELHDIGTKDYGVMQALVYVPLLLPSNLYQFFPMAGLLGCLLGLGRLASRSELIVMRAAGVSMAQIIFAVLKAALIMLVIATAMGEWLGPHAEDYAEHYKAIAMSGGQVLNTQQGMWFRDGDNFIHVNSVSGHGWVLQGITRYHINNHRLKTASYAQSGEFHQGQWVFNNIEQSTISNEQVTSAHFARQVWDVSFNPRLLNMGEADPSQLTLPRLYGYIQYLKQTHQSPEQAQFTFWQRLFQPLATVIMICLAVPFIFGPLRTVTMGLRILAGIVVGFGFYMLNQFFGPLSMVYQLPPLLAAALPTFLFAIGGGVLLWLTR